MTLLDQPGHVFIAHGDLTHVKADAVVYSTSTGLGATGHLTGPFARRFPWFAAEFPARIKQERPAGTGSPLGHAFWMREPSDCGPGVLVVASTFDRNFGTTTAEVLPREEIAARAVRNVIALAHRHFAAHPTGRRRLVAFPTLRQGMGGDHNDRLRSARAQIRAAHEALQGAPGLDAAFIPYTPDTYQIFLQARRDVLGPPPCPLPEGAASPRLGELVRAIRSGRCVLFVGSGLSWQLPNWTGLLNDLAAQLGRPPLASFDFREALDLAEQYVWEHGGKRLTAEIRKRYADYDRDACAPTAAHYLLLALPLRLIITTNYDDFLERTLRGQRRRHRLVVSDHDVIHTGSADPLCVVKFHGDAASGRGIVLARGHYEAFRIQHPGLALLLSGSLLNQTFLFVGYSRLDTNFQEIFGEVAGLYRGANWRAFATSVDPPAAGEEQLEVLQMPGEDAAQRIHQLSLFLDWLADTALLDSSALADADQPKAAEELPPGLFLAADIPVHDARPTATLRSLLLEAVAPQLERACDGFLHPDLKPNEARHLARLLRFLVEQGWRPERRGGMTSTVRLSRLWERLAESVADTGERRRCLAAAWRFAERHADVERLAELLREQ